MGKRDPRVDAYIDKAADFAKPILRSIREIVHAACPDVEENMKWGTPSFEYKGVLCGMHAFKEHATFGFWKAGLVLGRGPEQCSGVDQFGRLTKASDLPTKKELTAYIKKAMVLNDQGVKIEQPVRRRRPPLAVPDDLAAALRKNKKAQAAFEQFSPSHQREYVEWISEAKRQETRTRRLQTAIEQIAEGKSQNWKYMK
jgi:uncharacterized protein YdeI (YjbR/CyaY-like superfamily)